MLHVCASERVSFSGFGIQTGFRFLFRFFDINAFCALIGEIDFRTDVFLLANDQISFYWLRSSMVVCFEAI